MTPDGTTTTESTIEATAPAPETTEVDSLLGRTRDAVRSGSAAALRSLANRLEPSPSR